MKASNPQLPFTIITKTPIRRDLDHSSSPTAVDDMVKGKERDHLGSLNEWSCSSLERRECLVLVTPVKEGLTVVVDGTGVRLERGFWTLMLVAAMCIEYVMDQS